MSADITGLQLTENVPYSELFPSIPVYVQLTVTSIYTVLYSSIFLACYVQLWALLCFQYSRRRHAFSLLWMALAWSGLRILLFSFYWPEVGGFFKDTNSDELHISDASMFTPTLSYFLYAFPTCIQFFMLCLVASFAVGISSREFEKPFQTSKLLRVLLLVMCTLFLCASVITSIIQSTLYSDKPNPIWLTATRVLTQDILFLSVSVFLVIILRRVVKLPHVSLILESLNTGRCGLLFTGSFLIVAFATRAIYDIIALYLRSVPSFNFGWIDLSDHSEISERMGPNAAYATFAVVLFVWDFLPTAIVLFLFRLRRPLYIQAPCQSAGNSTFFSFKMYTFSSPRSHWSR